MPVADGKASYAFKLKTLSTNKMIEYRLYFTVAQLLCRNAMLISVNCVLTSCRCR